MKKILFILVILASIATVSAQLQIGTPGSNRLIPEIRVSANIIGQTATISFENIASQAQRVYLVIGTHPDHQDFTSLFGRGAFLMVRPSSSPSEFLILEIQPQGSLSFPIVGGLPDVYLQVAVIDPGGFGGIALSPPYTFQLPISTNRAAGALPQAITDAAAVQDPLTGKIYVFGGRIEREQRIDNITEIDFSKPFGTEIQPLLDHITPLSYNPKAIWDPDRHVAYIVAVQLGSNIQRIFKFDPYQPPGQRVEMLPDTFPNINDPRVYEALVRDPSTGIIYIMGGNSWAPNPTTVYSFDPSAPAGNRIRTLQVTLPPRTGAGMTEAVWDPLDRKAYVFDGFADSSSITIMEFVPDPVIGGRFTVLPDTFPSPHFNVAMVFSPRVRAALMLGGRGSGYPSPPLDDVYAFYPDRPAGSRVVRLGSLSEGLYGSSGVYDAISGRILLIGGLGSRSYSLSGLYQRILAFDPANNGIEPPLGMRLTQSAVSFFDSLHATAYVLGGQTYLYPTSQPQGNVVQTITAHGSSLFDKTHVLADTLPEHVWQGAAGAWNEQSRTFYMFGGYGSVPPAPWLRSNHIIQFRPDDPQGSRFQILPDTLPSNLSNVASVWDPLRDIAYILGGDDYTTVPPYLKIFTFDPSQPAGSRLRLYSEQLPFQVLGSRAIWYPPEQVIYIIGGVGGGRRIIRFNPASPSGQQFSVLDIASMPNYGGGPSLTYNPEDQAIYLFGGNDLSLGDLSNFYRFNPRVPAGPSQFSEVGQMAYPMRGSGGFYLLQTGISAVVPGRSYGGPTNFIPLFRP